MTKKTAGTARERRTLRQEAAVAAAFRLAERDGAAGLTMRRLGQELDVDATVLYRLFRDKDELLLAVCERTIELSLEQMQQMERTPEEEAWQDTLRRFAASTWQIQTRYPAITALTFARTTGGPAEQRMVELLLAAFARSGAEPERAVLLYRTFVDTALGLCAHAATLDQLGPAVQEKDATTWTRIYARQSEADYPVTRAHVEALAAVDPKALYDTAVEALIAATERAVAAG
ncbi:TetR family transcriptional regulator [Streptomyces sp. SID8379]|uniref:TetR/AcrR family transcriptional regulator n=1 Tax=unclassified Streptomyces TaxID=2593676 RepID=UPI0003740B92|nr:MULTISPECIES: TetR/AcrR family transcriptional regulator [unclassified Streptomyces]MYW64205.1 TetR family transcriptional regulator [Streptomyces sp. SID8379]